MKKTLYTILATCLFFASCSDFAETNIDPTRLADVNLTLMAPIVLTGHARNIGTNPGRVAGIIMQQYIGFDAQQVQYTSYILGEDAMNNYWRTGLYAGPLKDAQVMIDKAVVEGNKFYEALGKVIFASALADAASYFGDVPYTEALKGTEFLQPVYDLQENVYDAAFTLFDQAVADFGADDGTGYKGGDLVYGGDKDLWVKTAKGLKARHLMQLQKKRNVGSEVLSLIGASIQSVSEEPRFDFGRAETENWTLAKFGRERPNTLIIDPRFAAAMTDSEDPRKDSYMKFDGGVWQYFVLGDPDLVWALDDASVPLISYSELKFMEAEMYVRNGGGDAAGALADAITASMDLVGISPDSSASYIDANSNLGGFSDDQKIQKIIEEAYVAYYGHNFSQAWANFRRTGYPELVPHPQGTNGFNPSGVIPRRYIYVESETQTNSQNVQDARDRQGGGLLDQAVWAFE